MIENPRKVLKNQDKLKMLENVKNVRPVSPINSSQQWSAFVQLTHPPAFADCSAGVSSPLASRQKARLALKTVLSS